MRAYTIKISLRDAVKAMHALEDSPWFCDLVKQGQIIWNSTEQIELSDTHQDRDELREQLTGVLDILDQTDVEFQITTQTW